MSRTVISSLSNPLVKRVRALRQKKGRSESGLFLVEGLHHVGEAIEAGWDVDVILHAPGVLSSSFGRALLADNQARVQAVSDAVLDSLADKENPQGILAIVHQRPITLAGLPPIRRGVALVSPQDPGNVGTVLRTMDAVNVDVLVLVDGGVDPYHPTSVRASMGALFWKAVVQTSFDELMVWSKAQGLQRIASSAHAETNYRQFLPSGSWILLLGSEQKGLSQDQLKACDTAISLPMRGRASSLNLAVAAGILLYQLCQ